MFTSQQMQHGAQDLIIRLLHHINKQAITRLINTLINNRKVLKATSNNNKTMRKGIIVKRKLLILLKITR